MVVDPDPEGLERVAGELERRYSRDYRILRERSCETALATLRALREADEAVALVFAAPGEEGLRGDALLARSREVYPNARRGLLIEWGGWGDPETAESIFRAMALGHMDYYVLKPFRSPDEYFHHTVSEFLNAWSRSEEDTARETTLVAERWSRRGHELRTLLSHNGIPHAYHDADSAEGRRLLAALGLDPADGPVLQTVDGHALVDPSNAEVARAWGVRPDLGAERDFDLVIVGAGPAGLSAAVYAASEGLRTLVVEGEAIGGQAGSSSHIRNYLGFPRGVSGSDLAQQAYQQAWVFGARFLLMRHVTGLRTEASRLVVTISDGSEATARAVVLATGVAYRRIGLPGLEGLAGAGVFYGASVAEAKGLAGEEVFVVGGGNSAGQAATHLARYARRVTLVVRRSSLAETMSRYLVDQLDATPNVEIRLNAEVVDGGGEARLEWLAIRRTDGSESDSDEDEIVPATALFIMIGARPHTDWLPEDILRDRWGYVLTGEDVGATLPETDATTSARAVSHVPPRGRPLPFETSLPGVFAVGDVRHRSVKRVASAVGEGSVAIAQVHRHLVDAEREVPT